MLQKNLFSGNFSECAKIRKGCFVLVPGTRTATLKLYEGENLAYIRQWRVMAVCVRFFLSLCFALFFCTHEARRHSGKLIAVKYITFLANTRGKKGGLFF